MKYLILSCFLALTLGCGPKYPDIETIKEEIKTYPILNITKSDWSKTAFPHFIVKTPNKLFIVDGGQAVIFDSDKDTIEYLAITYKQDGELSTKLYTQDGKIVLNLTKQTLAKLSRYHEE